MALFGAAAAALPPPPPPFDGNPFKLIPASAGATSSGSASSAPTLNMSTPLSAVPEDVKKLLSSLIQRRIIAEHQHKRILKAVERCETRLSRVSGVLDKIIEKATAHLAADVRNGNFHTSQVSLLDTQSAVVAVHAALPSTLFKPTAPQPTTAAAPAPAPAPSPAPAPAPAAAAGGLFGAAAARPAAGLFGATPAATAATTAAPAAAAASSPSPPPEVPSGSMRVLAGALHGVVDDAVTRLTRLQDRVGALAQVHARAHGAKGGPTIAEGPDGDGADADALLGALEEEVSALEQRVAAAQRVLAVELAAIA